MLSPSTHMATQTFLLRSWRTNATAPTVMDVATAITPVTRRPQFRFVEAMEVVVSRVTRAQRTAARRDNAAAAAAPHALSPDQLAVADNVAARNAVRTPTAWPALVRNAESGPTASPALVRSAESGPTACPALVTRIAEPTPIAIPALPVHRDAGSAALGNVVVAHRSATDRSREPRSSSG